MAGPNVNTVGPPGPGVTSVATNTAQLANPSNAGTPIIGYFPTVLGGLANAAADTAAIQATALAAFNAGGGVVQLPSATIYLNSALPMYNGVIYNGRGWTLYPGAGTNQIPDGQGVSVTAGTILQPVTNGAFDAFDFNNVDASSDPYLGVQGDASRAMVYGCGIKNLAMQNFANGVKIGARYTAGACFATFSNLIALNCTQWGFWFENCLHPVFNTLRAYYCKVGHMMFVHSGTTVAAYNGDYYDLLAVTDNGSLAGGNIERGICFWSRNGAQSGMGTANIVQTNRYNTNFYTSPTSVSITAATPGVVSVPDLSIFAVGMPVVLNAGGAATGTASFVAKQTYWVASVSGASGAGTITLANSNYGTALANATAVSGLTISTNGFSGIEVTGRDSVAAISLYMFSPDTEGGGTSKLELQNAQNTRITGSIQSNGQSLNDIVMRGCAFNVFIDNSGNASIDSAAGDSSNTNVIVNGIHGVYGASSIKFPGFYLDANNSYRASLNLATNPTNAAALPSFYNIFNIGGIGTDGTVCGLPLAHFTNGAYGNPGAAFGIFPASGAGLISYSGSSSTTWTLPAIQNTSDGLEFCVTNAGTAAAGLGGTGGTTQQTYNFSARNSITLAIGASITLRARWNGGASYWQVIGIGGVYSAGAITTM
jgi:hypothetical protein